ncbi:hypothetical protein BRADI_4g04256v3 [Brachypodium distachyon]|uniref:Uncharacterized protein n=1 Tax=Brachypodium distachyon TaxID=15368 RepID=A0A0Q3EIP4_BRADI|nr:hypothetical protein BRADI_4g04256v3 [Brachypodium distachyon]KQJ86252.1 hypothetical protein BRADI_4g04256v3 [Brachypodium distachyon]
MGTRYPYTRRVFARLRYGYAAACSCLLPSTSPPSEPPSPASGQPAFPRAASSTSPPARAASTSQPRPASTSPPRAPRLLHPSPRLRLLHPSPSSPWKRSAGHRWIGTRRREIRPTVAPPPPDRDKTPWDPADPAPATVDPARHCGFRGSPEWRIFSVICSCCCELLLTAGRVKIPAGNPYPWRVVGLVKFH